MVEKRPIHLEEGQPGKFAKMARELGCDELEATFDAALKKVGVHKPTGKPTPRQKKSVTKKPAK